MPPIQATYVAFFTSATLSCFKHVRVWCPPEGKPAAATRAPEV